MAMSNVWAGSIIRLSFAAFVSSWAKSKRSWREHAGVAQCVVAAREDTPGDKRLVAYIVAANPQAAPPVEALRERLKQKLPEYMCRRRFVMMEKLPLTANGKIDRKALPPPEMKRANAVATYLAPRTPIEEVLTEIWRKILGLESGRYP